MKTPTLAPLLLLSGVLTLSACEPVATSDTSTVSETPRNAMTAQRMGELILQIDPDAELTASTWRFEAAGHVVAVVFDERADRMRIIIPIRSTKDLSEEDKTRMLQANFDSALDARYSIAQELIWGTFIHPLSPLTDEEFLSGLGQTVSVVETFGDTYSSGQFTFNAGDSAEMQRKRMLDLLRKQET